MLALILFSLSVGTFSLYSAYKIFTCKQMSEEGWAVTWFLTTVISALGVAEGL